MTDVGGAFADRLAGKRPGPLRAVVIAVAAGFTAAVVTYRLLRS